MPYHQGAAQEMKKILQANKKKKPKPNNKVFEMKSDKISDSNMKKFLKEGDSFSKAHSKAVKLDKKK